MKLENGADCPHQAPHAPGACKSMVATRCMRATSAQRSAAARSSICVTCPVTQRDTSLSAGRSASPGSRETKKFVSYLPNRRRQPLSCGTTRIRWPGVKRWETVTRSGACARSLLPCRAAPLSPAHCRTHHHAPAGAQMRAAHAGTTSWRDHNGVFVQIRRAVSPREVPGAWHTVRKVATCRVKKHAPHPW